MFMCCYVLSSNMIGQWNRVAPPMCTYMGGQWSRTAPPMCTNLESQWSRTTVNVYT